MFNRYKGYKIEKDARYDGVVILKDGDIVAHKVTEDEAKRAIDKWLGCQVVVDSFSKNN